MDTCALRYFQRTNCQIVRLCQQLWPLYNLLEILLVVEILLAEDSQYVSSNQLEALRNINHGTRDTLKMGFSLLNAAKHY